MIEAIHNFTIFQLITILVLISGMTIFSDSFVFLISKHGSIKSILAIFLASLLEIVSTLVYMYIISFGYMVIGLNLEFKQLLVIFTISKLPFLLIPFSIVPYLGKGVSVLIQLISFFILYISIFNIYSFKFFPSVGIIFLAYALIIISRFILSPFLNYVLLVQRKLFGHYSSSELNVDYWDDYLMTRNHSR